MASLASRREADAHTVEEAEVAEDPQGLSRGEHFFMEAAAGLVIDALFPNQPATTFGYAALLMAAKDLTLLGIESSARRTQRWWHSKWHRSS